jgi:hypothetical protein
VINGRAYDKNGNETLSKVGIKIDNKSWINASGTSTWTYNWDTTTVENGVHIIKLRSKDNTGLYSNINSLTVNVYNN